ncbi:MAG: helix-turn-helix domain-containing protein [Sulfolobales archaeon]
MPKIDVNKLDDQKKLKILEKVVEKHGLSYVSRYLGINRSTINRYINGKIQKIPNNVIEKASELLTVDELSDLFTA